MKVNYVCGLWQLQYATEHIVFLIFPRSQEEQNQSV